MFPATRRTYLDNKRIFVRLGQWAIVGLRIVRNLVAGSAKTVSILLQV